MTSQISFHLWVQDTAASEKPSSPSCCVRGPGGDVSELSGIKTQGPCTTHRCHLYHTDPDVPFIFLSERSFWPSLTLGLHFWSSRLNGGREFKGGFFERAARFCPCAGICWSCTKLSWQSKLREPKPPNPSKDKKRLFYSVPTKDDSVTLLVPDDGVTFTATDPLPQFHRKDVCVMWSPLFTLSDLQREKQSHINTYMSGGYVTAIQVFVYNTNMSACPWFADTFIVFRRIKSVTPPKTIVSQHDFTYRNVTDHRQNRGNGGWEASQWNRCSGHMNNKNLKYIRYVRRGRCWALMKPQWL